MLALAIVAIIGSGVSAPAAEASLYAFSSHTFTPCGATGRSGPTVTACRSAYSTTWDESSANFDVVNGIQRWTVPVSGIYRISAAGAGGGGTYAGRGRIAIGTFTLAQGDVLHLAVGQAGTQAGSSDTGGGGGGSFVTTSSGTHLVVGGGGGGSGVYATTAGDAPNSTAGSNGVGNGGAGGSNGSGGVGSSYGGGGGGISQGGGRMANWQTHTRQGGSGYPTLTGGEGGGAGTYPGGAHGGFGGGAGQCGCNTGGGGGGGGYSGGGGGGSVTGFAPGGGGGSYVIGSATDASTGSLSAASDGSILIEMVAPVATSFAATTSSPTNSTAVDYSVTFSEAVTGFTAADISLSGTSGGLGLWTITEPVGSGAGPYTFTVTNSIAGEGAVVATIAANAITGATSGTTGPAAATDAAAVFIDRTRPTATITTATASPSRLASVSYTVTFSEAISGLAGSDFSNLGTATGCTFTPASATGTTITVAITGCSDGTLEPVLAQDAVDDAAGNTGPSTAETGPPVTLDYTAPSASWSSVPTSPARASTLEYGLTFSEDVTGIAAADFQNTGTAAGCAFAPSASTATGGTPITVTVTSCGPGTLILRLKTSTVSDTVGNTGPTANTDAASVTLTRKELAFKITSLGTSGSTRDMNQYTGDDRGGIAINTAYVFLTGDNGLGRAALNLSVPAQASTATWKDGIFSDLKTRTAYTFDQINGSNAATLTRFAPVNYTGNGIGTAINLSSNIPYSGNGGIFSGYGRVVYWNASTGRVYDIDLPSGHVTDRGTLRSLSHERTENGVDHWGVAEWIDGELHLATRTGNEIRRTRVSDGNVTTIQTFSNLGDMASWIVDPGTNRWYYHYENSAQFGSYTEALGYASATMSTEPGVSLTPTATASNQTSITYSLVTDDAVTGVTAADFTIGGTSPGWAISSITGSGTSHTITLTQTGTGDGTVDLRLSATSLDWTGGGTTIPSSAIDAATVTIDRVAPTATLATTATSPVRGSAISYTATFSEAISGLAGSDFSNLGTATGCTFTPASATGTTITVTISGCGEGTFQIRLAQDAVEDAAGNTGPAADVDGVVLAVDGTAPSASWSSVPASPARASTLEYGLTFSEDVTGIAAADFQNTGTAVGCAFAPSASTATGGTPITVTVTSCGPGTLILRLKTSTVSDTVGNTGPTANTDAASVTLTRKELAFKITSLGTSGSTRDMNQYTGDDRGGIAFNTDFVFLTGDNGLGRANTNLSVAAQASTATWKDGIFSDLKTRTAYTFDQINGSNAATLTRFAPVYRIGNGIGTAINLSSNIPYSGNGGIFSGYGRVVYWNASTGRVYDIDLPSGHVTDRGTLSSLSHTRTENGVDHWGVAEWIDGELHLATRTGNEIRRTRVSDGNVTTIQTFSNLGDMASWIVDPGTNRWYYHYENSAQFGSYTEALGYASATVSTSPTILLSPAATQTTATTITYTLAADEAITGVTAADFTIGGTSPGWAISSITGSGTSYTITLTQTGTGDGTVDLQLDADSVDWTAGGETLPDTAVQAATVLVDRNPPTATWSTSPTNPTNATTLTFALTFSESISGLTASDLTNPGTAGCTLTPAASSGTVITVTATSCGEGTLDLRLAAGAVTDGTSTGPAAALDAPSVTIDRTRPTASWTATPASPTNASTLTYALGFSETISGLEAADIVNAGTATGCIFTPAASTGTSIAVNATGCSAGTVIARLTAGSITDGANTGPAAALSAPTVTIDTTAPTATWSTEPSSPTNSSTPTYTVAFSESINGLTASDFSVTGTATGCTVTVSAATGTSSTVALSGCTDGTATLRLAADAVSDAAGNTAPAAALIAETITIDTIAPAALWSPGQTSPTNATTLQFTLAFTEDVSAPTPGDLRNVGTAPNCVFAVTSGDSLDQSFGIEATACDEGTVIPRLASGSVADPAGNTGPASATLGAITTVDRSAPTLAITSTPTTPTNTLSPAPSYRLVFSEAISGLAASDLTNAGTAPDCTFAPSSSTGAAVDVSVSGCSADGTIVLQVAAGSVTDAAGNTGPTAAVSASIVRYDTQPPNASWSTAASNPTNASSIAFSLTFTETITGLDDVDITNAGTATGCSASVGGATGASAGVPVTVTFTGCGEGTLVPQLDANTILDGANTSGPTQDVRATGLTIDRTAPTASWSAVPASPTNSATLTYTAAFSETVTGVASGDFAIAGGAGAATGCTITPAATTGRTIDVDVTGCSDGDVALSLLAGQITDLAGNAGPASAVAAGTVDLDQTAPTAVLIAPAGPTNATTLTFDLVLSGDSTGIDAADFSFQTGTGAATGCQVQSVSASAGARVTVTANGCSEGWVQLRLDAGTIIDPAGNAGPTTTQRSAKVVVDRTAPTATFTSTPPDPNPGTSIVYTLTFDESISGLSDADITISGTATGCSDAVSGASGASFQITITGCSEGTVNPVLTTGSVVDRAGNVGPSLPPAQARITVDLTPPTAQVTAVPASPTPDTTLQFAVRFSEPIAGLTGADFSNAAPSNAATGCSFSPSATSPTDYGVTVTGCSEGDLLLEIGATTVTDAATNAGPTAPEGANSLVEIDRTPPAFTWATSTTSPTNASSLSFSLTPDSPITGITASDIVNAGTASGCVFTPNASAGDASTPITVTATGCGDGTVIPRLTSAAAADAAGNDGPSVDTDMASPITVDRTAPTRPVVKSGPDLYTTSLTGTFTFDDEGGTVECAVDGGAWQACSSPVTIAGPLAEGPHTLEVRETDAAGNVSATGSYAWTIDLTAPAATWSTEPSPITNAATLSYVLDFGESVTGVAVGDFTVTGTATGCTVAVGADTGATRSVDLTSCSEGTVDLSYGGAPTDLAGNALASTAQTTQVTIDRTAPTATALAAPSGPGEDGRLSYTLTLSEPLGATPAPGDFEIGGTSAAWSVESISGTGPYTVTLAPTGVPSEGTVDLALTAGSIVDRAGNAGPASRVASSPASVDIVIDVTPDGIIGFGATPYVRAAGTTAVDVSCPAQTETCAVVLTLLIDGRVVTTADQTFTGDSAGTLSLQLPLATQRLLARRGTLSAELISVLVVNGVETRTTTTVTLVAPKAPRIGAWRRVTRLDGTTTLRASCIGTPVSRCDGTITLYAKRGTLRLRATRDEPFVAVGSVRLGAAADARLTGRITLNAAGRRLLRQQGAIRVTPRSAFDGATRAPRIAPFTLTRMSEAQWLRRALAALYVGGRPRADLNHLLDAYRAGQIDGRDVADRIRGEIRPARQRARARAEGLPTPPARMRPIARLLLQGFDRSIQSHAHYIAWMETGSAASERRAWQKSLVATAVKARLISAMEREGARLGVAIPPATRLWP